MVLVKGYTYRSMEQNRKSRKKNLTYIWLIGQLIFNKGAKTICGEMITFTTNDPEQ